jgi:hypothetical protein
MSDPDFNIYSRVGRIEGEMVDVKVDITEIKGLIDTNAKQVNVLANWMNQKKNEKQEMSRWGMIVVAALLSLTASVVSAYLVSMILH